MRYLMNSAVIPEPGTYHYRIIPAGAARLWLMAGPWHSRVVYGETARYIQRKLGVQCPLSRVVTRMKPGDEALVVRLKYRAQDPSIKQGGQDLRDEDFEIGLLERIE